MKKYSIISVVNKSYTEFAYVFVKSALEKLNLDSLIEIRLLDTGIDSVDKVKLSSLHPKVVIQTAKAIHNSNEPWDEGWQENVLLKTNFAYDYLFENKVATFMIDIDSMFINTLQDIVELEVDAIVCDRSDLWAGMPAIASFVGFINVENSLNFIKVWRDKMNFMLEKGFKTRETPALNEVIKYNTTLNIAGISHQLVGLYKTDLETDETRILHFKGDGESEGKPIEEAVSIRLNKFKKYNSKIKKYLEDV